MALATRKKPNSKAYKKVSGRHHRHSKDYVKTYWPYLPMLLTVLVGLAINSIWAGHNVLGSASDFASESLLNYTNQARSADNETSLTLDPQLTAAAQAKANDMAAKNYWAHNSPSGQTPWDFIKAAGYSYQLAGENLAYGFNNANDTVIAWMNSPEHRANILNAGYTNVGFGVANSPNYQGQGPKTIVVAEYGEPVGMVANIRFSVPNPIITGTGKTGAEDVLAVKSEPSSQLVSRVQLLTGGHASWSLMAVTTLAAAAVMLFVIRHGLWLRRALLRGEVFITHHPFLDMVVVMIIMAGYILTRSSGFVR